MEEDMDRNLYNDFLNGDDKAFEEIVIKYRKSVTDFIYKIVHDYSIAEDLAQDVFLYILVNKDVYNPKYKLKTFLFTIARSRSLNYIKKSKREISIDTYEYYLSETTDYLDNVDNKEKLERINSILKSLKPDYQTVIYLADFEKFSNKDISKILNKTDIQTKALIYNARKKLRTLLEKEGITYDE